MLLATSISYLATTQLPPAQQFAALVYRDTSDFSWGVGAALPIEYNAEAYDLTSWHDNVSNPSRLTIPTTVSLVRAVSNIYGNLDAADVWYGHRKNGSAFAGRGYTSGNTTGDEVRNSASAIVGASAGDHFEYYKELSVSGSIYDSDHNWFGVEIIDPSIKYALVQKSGNQSVSAATATTISYDTEVADTSGFHDNVTNNSRLTVPSGVTLVRLSCSIANNGSTGGQNYVTIAKNGVGFVGQPSTDVEFTGQKFLSCVSPPLVVTPGDYFTVIFLTTNAETVPSANGVWFQIEEVPAATKRALVKKSAGQSLSAATWTALAFGAEEYDTDSIHDNSSNNSRLTVPSGCTWARLTFNVKNPSTAGQLSARVTKNGAGNIAPGLPAEDTETAGTDSLNGFGAWVQVTAGDYFELEVNSTNAVTLAVDNELWFAGEFM